MHQDHEPTPTLDPAADARVTEALNALGSVEPPAEFVGQVMWRTRHHQVARNRTRVDGRLTGDRMATARKALIGLAGIAAAGLAAVYFGGIPPTARSAGTEGAIGAAQRYQTEQIARGDVKLGDGALQALMQTDTFDRLIHDKQAVAALARPEVQQALMSPQFQQAMASQAFIQALSASGVQAAMASPAFQQALTSQAVQAAMAIPAFQQALASSAFQQAMASSEFRQSLSIQGFFMELQAQALQSSDANVRQP